MSIPPLYTDFEKALQRARERANANRDDEEYLSELLLISYGTHLQTGEIVYRPFYVAAKYLEQSRRDQTLEAADNAKFTGQAVPIKSLLDMQAALDASLMIDRAFQINPAQPNLGQLKTMYESAIVFLTRYQPRGIV